MPGGWQSSTLWYSLSHLEVEPHPYYDWIKRLNIYCRQGSGSKMIGRTGPVGRGVGGPHAGQYRYAVSQ
jgi:hypothetical protein